MIVHHARNRATQHYQRNIAAAETNQHCETESTWGIPGANPGPHLEKDSRAIQQHIQSDEHDRNAHAPGARGISEQQYVAGNDVIAVPGVRLCLGFHHKYYGSL